MEEEDGPATKVLFDESRAVETNSTEEVEDAGDAASWVLSGWDVTGALVLLGVLEIGGRGCDACAGAEFRLCGQASTLPF